MKLSTFGIGLAVASSLLGVASLVQPANAASIQVANGTFDFSGLWEFKYFGSYGNAQSDFFIKEGSSTTTMISENGPGVVTTATTLNSYYSFTQPTAQFGLTFPGESNILSGNNIHFWVGSATNPYTGFLFSYDPDEYSHKFQEAISSLGASGYTYAIGVEDRGPGLGDTDHNDFIVLAKPVPVPAIVPGIALASAFFGVKSLRNKKKVDEASQSVA
ncbi:hypothetical protein [Pseudanabaena yagii]|uniref:PEP-CTERM sorting domain-containing protein n=1 Tax=Pseudanabaena yagii GIHE-NHR1 TaxID=2722753 RepID=A0ABX1LT48_9CYAN|nr:hypothetical protein [Pseudanabaena yagii]NMF59332.1 hypothetical protein [Pseudanabaena yagii GIHE-NHR1]